MKNPFHHTHDHHEEPNEDGIDRRGFLECMAWAGTGILCVGNTKYLWA